MARSSSTKQRAAPKQRPAARSSSAPPAKRRAAVKASTPVVAKRRAVKSSTAAPKRRKSVAPPPPPQAAPEVVALTDAIRRDPADPAPYLVLADLLQAAGDPRGELIAIQHALVGAPENPELQRAEEALFERHATTLLGVDRETIRRLGTVLTWRLGFLDQVRVAFEGRGPELCRLLQDVFATPSATLLHSLVLQIGIKAQEPCKALVETLARSCPTTLHTLRFNSRDAKLGKLERVWARVPGLRELKIGNWAGFEVGTLELPQLRSLDLVGPRRADVAAILDRPRPALRRLHLDLFSTTPVTSVLPLLHGAIPSLRDLGLQINGGGFELAHLELGGIIALSLEPVPPTLVRTLVETCQRLRSLRLRFVDGVTTQDVQPILDGALPNLRDLYLPPIDGDPGLSRILNAPILPRLESLALSGRIDLRQLVDAAAAFDHLRDLVVDTFDATGSDELFEQAKRRLPALRLGSDRLVVGNLRPWNLIDDEPSPREVDLGERLGITRAT